MGRPRLKGERLPNLSVVGEDPSTLWTPITVANWYGSAERTVGIISETAVWHSTGLPAVPLRWVLIRDPEEESSDTQALLCTDLDADAERTGLVVREALADGSHLSRGAAAPRVRDAKALVGGGDPEDRSGAVGSVCPWLLSVCSPADGARLGHRSSPNGLVRQEASDLLRRSGAGEKGVVGTRRGGFLRVALGHRDGKSPAGSHGTLNRRGLLWQRNG